MKYTTVSVREVKGKYYARLRGKDSSGKWVGTDRVIKGVTGKREANKKAKELLEEVNKDLSNASDGSELQKEFRTIEQVIRSYLDYQLNVGEIGDSTYYLQTKTYNSFVDPYIGQVIFDTLDRNTINAWLTKLNAKYKLSSIKLSYSLVNKVYKYYVMIGELDKNPFDTVKRPKAKGINTTHLTNNQMAEFLTALYSEYEPKDWMYPALHLAFYGGLRRSEIMALRYRNIDFSTNTIHIDSAIGIRLGGEYTKETKTKSSNRVFYMPSQLAEALKRRVEAVNPEPNWYVCGNEDRFYTNTYIGKMFRKFRDAYDLKDAYGKPLKLHGLRHNLGAVGIASKMDIASLSMMLGHSSLSTTLDIYGDASEDAKQIGKQRLEKGFIEKSDPEGWYYQKEEEVEKE